MRIIRAIVLIAFFSPDYLQGSQRVQKTNVLSFCTEQNQPIFIFQHLWTDSPQPAKRKNEFWIDRDKDIIRAFWWGKGEKPKFLIGSQISETDFYLCGHDLGQKKPKTAFVGRVHSTGIILESADGRNSSAFKFVYTPFLTEDRRYSLRYDTRSVKHQIIGKIPSDRPFTCDTTVSSFQLVANQPTKAMEHANRKISALAEDIVWERESADCQNPKNPPSVKALGVNLMFGSDRFLSAKMDFSQVQGLTGMLQGKSLNLDLTTQTDLDWNSILHPADQKILLKELNRRIKLAYGNETKVAELAACGFTFNSQTLVVSGAPQGVFEDRVDIPIPLDHIFGVLKIKPHGPLARP